MTVSCQVDEDLILQELDQTFHCDSHQAGKLNSHVDGAHFLTGRKRGKKTIRKLWHVLCFDAFYQQWHQVSSGISCSDAGNSPSNSQSAVGCLQFSLFPPPKAEAPSVQTCAPFFYFSSEFQVNNSDLKQFSSSNSVSKLPMEKKNPPSNLLHHVCFGIVPSSIEDP